MRNWALCLGYKKDENIHNPPASVLPHDNCHFQSVCRKDVQCGESPQDFYANFGGDPLLMKHRMTASCGHCFSYGFTVRQVLHRIGPSCGLYMTALTEDPWYGMNLKLHHRQMHYRQSPSLNVFTMKMATKGVKNTPPEHEKT